MRNAILSVSKWMILVFLGVHIHVGIIAKILVSAKKKEKTQLSSIYIRPYR